VNRRDLKPPKWANKLLQFYCSERYLEEIQGDLHEWFHKRVEKQGYTMARLFYFLDVIRFFRIFRLKSNYTSNTNQNRNYYFKLTIRSIIRNKFTSLLQMGNLSIGFAVFLMVSIYLIFESNYDTHHTKADNLFRLELTVKNQRWAAIPPAARPYILTHFPEVENMTRISGLRSGWVRYEDKVFNEDQIVYADNSLFSLFDFELISGKLASASDTEKGAIITESMALKFFGVSDPIGETMEFEIDNGVPREVLAVIKDVSYQSHLRFDFICLKNAPDERWRGFNYYTYLETNNPNFLKISNTLASEFDSQYKMDTGSFDIHFMPVKDIHLYADSEKEFKENIDIGYLYVLFFAALFVLIISCINYINITLIKSFSRIKEARIKIALGVSRKQLIYQFLVEASYIVTISFLISIMISVITISFFREFSELPLTLSSLLTIKLIILIVELPNTFLIANSLVLSFAI